MSLSLPTKIARPTPENLKLLQAGLTSVISGHPQSIQPWTFYEELDQYLGPWGNQGYPIAYGNFYCVAFNSNEKLMAERSNSRLGSQDDDKTAGTVARLCFDTIQDRGPSEVDRKRIAPVRIQR
jgi:hypothetical protein